MFFFSFSRASGLPKLVPMPAMNHLPQTIDSSEAPVIEKPKKAVKAVAKKTTTMKKKKTRDLTYFLRNQNPKKKLECNFR